MVTKGLLVRLEAQPGKEEAVEQFLTSALPLVQSESGTAAWFAVRFGRAEYGIFDAFADEAGREAHLNGSVAKILMERSETLFANPPRIQRVDVLADKFPSSASFQAITKAILLTFKAKVGHEGEVSQFLRDAKPLVMEEAETIAWFAIRLDNDEYGIFDVFPDNGARLKHLIGHVPRELVKHSLTLLGSMPDIEMLNVLATKL